MNAFQIIFGILDIIVCIALVVIIITQSSKSGGLGAIGGQSDAGFGVSKAKSLRNEAIYSKITIVLAVVFVVLSIALFAMTNTKAPNVPAAPTATPSSAAPSAAPSASPSADGTTDVTTDATTDTTTDVTGDATTDVTADKTTDVTE